MTLSNKQRAFVEGYLRCWNATQAAKEAGYSPRTAKSIGSENLTKPDVQAEITQRLQEYHMRADEALKLLTDQARASIKPFIKITSQGFLSFDFSQPGAIEHIHLIKRIKSKRSKRIVGRGSEVEEWEDEYIEIELLDAQHALELIGKHLGLFETKPQEDLRLQIDNIDEILKLAYGEKVIRVIEHDE